ncbi:unnamed protein product, partial [Prorocentrum cordatum]
AIDLINDPQALADRLLQRVSKGGEPFLFRLLLLHLVARLVGRHELLLLNLYPFVLKYLVPTQREVTKVLACLVEACHKQIPPDELRPVVMHVMNSFVTEAAPHGDPGRPAARAREPAPVAACAAPRAGRRLVFGSPRAVALPGLPGSPRRWRQLCAPQPRGERGAPLGSPACRLAAGPPGPDGRGRAVRRPARSARPRWGPRPSA